MVNSIDDTMEPSLTRFGNVADWRGTVYIGDPQGDAAFYQRQEALRAVQSSGGSTPQKVTRGYEAVRQATTDLEKRFPYTRD